MANRRVRLVRSVKLNGVWKFLNPIKAQRLRIPNSEGRWYISWREGSKKKWERADSWSHAMALQHKKEAELHAIAAGVELPKPKPDRLKIEDAYTHFKDDLTLRDRRDETLEGYRLVFDTFPPTCQKQFLEEIDRHDLLKFAQAMRKSGLSPRTVSNRWLAFHAFLKHFNITGLTKRMDAPRYVEPEPQCYEKADLEKFFTTCNDGQRLLFQFLLMTGARMQEAMYCQWRDLNFTANEFTVREKPEYDFRPKSWECRVVPLQDALAKELQRRSTHCKATALVFGTRTGKPNNKMLQACKRAAKRAGFDEAQWWLHKFRATFCTWHADAGVPLPTIQLWMGHKSLETTMRYIRPNRSDAVKAKFNATFAGM